MVEGGCRGGAAEVDGSVQAGRGCRRARKEEKREGMAVDRLTLSQRRRSISWAYVTCWA